MQAMHSLLAAERESPSGVSALQELQLADRAEGQSADGGEGMTHTQFRAWLVTHSACSDAMAWLDTQDAPDLAAVWATCPRADWLLWLCRFAEPDILRQALVRAAVECAALALPYTTDPRVSACIDATRGWCEGAVSDGELRVKRAAASASAYAAAAAAYAYSAASAAASRAQMRARCADIVRQYINCPTLRVKA